MDKLDKNLQQLRNEYSVGALNEADVCQDPLEQFELWFNQALEAKVLEPNAFTFATVDETGQPSARILLLKGISKHGLTFFTNYLSRKAQQLEKNPKAAMVFLWAEIERQVRVEGIVTKVTQAESEDYFQNRPMGSRLGAWASHQSTEIPNRTYLENKMAELQKQYDGKDIEKPDFWGGYRLNPTLIEFWQGRPSRLHDRIQYKLQPDNTWKISRLSP